MPGSLEGRVAIVTGAGQGMGQAFARALAAAGAHVAVAELSTATGEATAAEIREAGLADRETFTDRATMRRFASPEEIADGVVFLVSDAASGITAEVVTVDGGWIAWGGIEEPVGV